MSMGMIGRDGIRSRLGCKRDELAKELADLDAILEALDIYGLQHPEDPDGPDGALRYLRKNELRAFPARMEQARFNEIVNGAQNAG